MGKVTNRILHRVFQLYVPDKNAGTCFCIEHDNKQYIITAKHIAEEIPDCGHCQIYHDRQWKSVKLNLVGHCHNIDISVLATDRLMCHPFDVVVPRVQKIQYGDEVYFLGFPYGWGGDIGEKNYGYPLPFIKKATISCFDGDEFDPKIYLDGRNTHGFSGGPVIVKKNDSQDYCIFAVISANQIWRHPVYRGDEKTEFEYEYNTGLVLSYGIWHAIKIIDYNPVGYKIT